MFAFHLTVLELYLVCRMLLQTLKLHLKNKLKFIVSFVKYEIFVFYSFTRLRVMGNISGIFCG